MTTPKVTIFSQISKLHPGRNKFVFFTTPLSGLQLAKGLIETGLSLLKVRGLRSGSLSTGSRLAQAIYRLRFGEGLAFGQLTISRRGR